ncbi:MAG TPA: sigma-54 dependent transcriptional regulator, partial [Polyangiaceae bacterium]|nr:sigma-54 dependent transcriptional regulator [Polyangiaceae bacterium]
NATLSEPKTDPMAQLDAPARRTFGVSTLSLEAEADGGNSTEADTEPVRFGALIGSSPQMRELFTVLERIAAKLLSLLIQGETGTGKEEVARAVHNASPRSSGPFIVLDSTTIPSTLAESVLFGHERGAFTSADSRHIGAFERAHGGTIFIDEIGELPLTLQTKLLRVLERRELTRVGGKELIPVDVRVISATHRDLRIEVEKGRFREDLYFRLAQVRVVLPPLRARADDILGLANHFLRESAVAATEGRVLCLDEEAAAELLRRPFPGNVRELRNLVERAAAFSENGIIRCADLSGEGYEYSGSAAVVAPVDAQYTTNPTPPVEVDEPFVSAKQRAVDRFEREYLDTLMRRTRGNISQAAREAGLARHYLRELLRKHGLYFGAEGGNTEPPPSA